MNGGPNTTTAVRDMVIVRSGVGTEFTHDTVTDWLESIVSASAAAANSSIAEADD